jgi:predicted phage-related endonuclease
MWWGRELEPIVIKKYELETGKKVSPHLDGEGNQRRVINSKYPWLFAHVDGLIADEKLIFEAKTTGFFSEEWGEEGSDEVPNEYLLQCAHYCIVLDDCFKNEGVELAADDGRKKLRIYRYNRNKELEQKIIDGTHDFWHNHVLANVPPEPTSKDNLAKIYNVCHGNPILADVEICKKVLELSALKHTISLLEKNEENLKSEIQLYMKENSELIDVNGKVLASWKSSTSNKLDQKKLKASGLDLTPYYTETSMRRFLVKKP